ncbi:hypothetical protein [Actinomadura sp. 7K507]|uniref:hypothetical protein n=1 Tax=Actinomadura sp. 7K507 TaxID=2530365 RepID=UPI001044A17B|nr:hypothetical protein [Actinomadura sp. 7K507]TDC80739.1 hypothetical protein E1285_34275 [Actinomadura sp. 7K507]
MIRVETAAMAGRHGASSMRLPLMAQIGDSPRITLQVGDNPVPLPPGVWPVRVWCLYYGIKTGRAELTVDTRAGQPVLLYYMAPRTIYNRGVLAYQPTERQGKSTLALIYGLAIGVTLLAVVLAAVLSG